MLSLIYISKANAVGDHGSTAFAKDVAHRSAESNRALDVTGALIFTTTHFAQILEGPGPSVEKLMKKIEKDWRHSRIRVLQRRLLHARMFPQWSMAYAGGPVALDEFIAKALLGEERSVQNEELLCRLIVQFAYSRNAQGKLNGAARVGPTRSSLETSRQRVQ